MPNPVIGCTCTCSHTKFLKKGLAPFLLRLTLALVFIPAGLIKFTGGYTTSVESIISMSAGLVPVWLATFMGYFLPIAELYIGLALLLGFGKLFTKIITLIVTFSVAMFWYLKSGSDFTWLMDATFLYFIIALVIFFQGFG